MTALARLLACAAVPLAVLVAEAGTASEPAPLPHPLAGLAATLAKVAEVAGREAGRPDAGAPATGTESGSRLLRSLSDRPAQVASSSSPTVGDHDDPGVAAMVGPASAVLFGCPRALLAALLAGAAETGDAVSALAIERETLALCRERQKIVTGIVKLEGELGALLEESRTRHAGAAVTAAAALTVKEPAPVRVVTRLISPGNAGGTSAPEMAKAPQPSYSWFSIIGTAGDLRAGVTDGASVWFVRKGDRLPGAVVIEGIEGSPPGVRAGGAAEAALPYQPRPAGAMSASDGMTAGDGP